MQGTTTGEFLRVICRLAVVYQSLTEGFSLGFQQESVCGAYQSDPYLELGSD